MSQQLRMLTEQRELDLLSPYAAKASESRGREVNIPEDPIRTCYQRDRDRVLHSKGFRRLKHKTQVFIDPLGDHYRTRMTHSLEVAQIARTIGRALQLNEDLIEAIALAHDVGHTPFGHAGEAALDEAIRELRAERNSGPNHFRHYEQSLRVVDVLDNLNLTYEVRAGIDGHSKGRKDLSSDDGEPVSTLEAAVVRISDRIAYLNHDLDDALRSRIIDDMPIEFREIGDTHGARIGAMVEDVIRHSTGHPAIKMSADLLQRLNYLKEWLFTNVYLRYPEVFPDTRKAQAMVKALFRHYTTIDQLPAGYEGVEGAIDYVAGMTDRFAVRDYLRLTIPAAFEAPEELNWGKY